jgi:large subunit ribosomal protein L34e
MIKSRSLRRVFKRVPSGISKVFYLKRKPSKSKCSNCSIVLQGMAPSITSKLRNSTKSSKRPQRKFGGNLCSKCTKQRIIQEARK